LSFWKRNIVGDIGVEIIVAHDMPGRSGIRQRVDGGNRRSLHLPERERSVVVLPQNVGVAGAGVIEVGGCLEVPVRRDERKRRNAKRSAVVVHEPEDIVPGVVAPENVS